MDAKTLLSKTDLAVDSPSRLRRGRQPPLCLRSRIIRSLICTSCFSSGG